MEKERIFSSSSFKEFFGLFVMTVRSEKFGRYSISVEAVEEASMNHPVASYGVSSPSFFFLNAASSGVLNP